MRTSRNSDISLIDTEVIQPGELNPRQRTILEILWWHRFLPSEWIIHHFPTALKAKGTFKNNLRRLRNKQNGYIKWADAPLNLRYATGRQGVYELTDKGAKAIGLTLQKRNKNEDAHELLVALHECSLKFQARAAGLNFEILEPERYQLPSKQEWVPDGHTLVFGDTLIHSEIERRHYAEGKKKTEEKIEKALEYQRERLFKEDGFSKSLILFLSTSDGRTNTLMEYVSERTKGSCSFICFATTKDWAFDTLPKPDTPLVTEWLRVGHPPLKLV
jgi:hypothetical protein